MGAIEIVYRQDVNMFQTSSETGFTLKTDDRLFIASNRPADHLNGDIPFDTRLVSPVHRGHTPFAYFHNDLVGTKFLANHSIN